MTLNTNRFLAVWDCNGLESIFDVNKELQAREDWEKENLFDILNEEPTKRYEPSIPLQSLLIRAIANEQRNYEIYEFNTVMSGEDIVDIFNTSTQTIVDWVRENGNKIYSGYVSNKQRVIT